MPKKIHNTKMEQPADEQRLYDVFAQTPAAIGVVKGPRHVFEFVNPLYLQLVGRNKDIVGKAARDAFPELEGQGFFELLDSVYKTGEPYVGNEMPIEWKQ